MAEPCVSGVPVYFYPWPASTWWRQLADMRPGSVIIVNPASGPGDAIDARYAAAIENARARGVAVFGYVDSDYGAIGMNRVGEESSLHKSWYAVDGIFVDRVAPDDASLPHYSEVARRVREIGLAVAFNAGQPDVDPGYAEVADHLVMFEGSLSTYLESQFPRWSYSVEPRRVWHLVYGVATEEAMQSVVARAAASNAGIVYVNDGVLPNPWDHLPPYWEREQHVLDEASPGA